MKYGKVFLYGFFVWIITLAIAMVLFQVRNNDRIFFEAIMPVVLVANLAIFSRLYLKGATFVKNEGFYLGIIWMALNIVLDLLVFSSGPMKMSLADYLKDIGVTYLIFPIITSVIVTKNK